MDDAQAWCQDIEELYNMAEVHTTNTSKGDAANVGIFSDNSKVIVFKFLESQSWGIWVEETLFRKPTDYILSNYPTRLNLI